MKKLKINLFALSLVSILSLVSCDKEDQSYTNTTNSPIGTLVADKTSISESDDDATLALENVASYTFTMDKAYKTPLKFKVELIASESTGSTSDFETTLPESGIDNGSEGFLITVPANATSTSFTITGILDAEADLNEVLKFRITPATNLNGLVDANSETFTLNVGNSTSDNLDIIFDWDVEKTFLDIDGEEHSYGDYDFDLEIAFNGTVVLTSYSSKPEAIEFLSTYPDGTFVVKASFYDVAKQTLPVNGVPTVVDVQPMLPINFKPTLSVVKNGIFAKEFDLSGIWNSTAGGSEQGNPNAVVDVCKFVKTGSIYQVLDMNDNVLVTGKSGIVKNAIKNISKAAKGGRK